MSTLNTKYRNNDWLSPNYTSRLSILMHYPLTQKLNYELITECPLYEFNAHLKC